MAKRKLDFIIDSLTNSIRNTISGDSFETNVIRLNNVDVKNVTKKNGWQFNWNSEFNDISKEVYKLTIDRNESVIQGLISISIEQDHVYMNLLESAHFNVGKNKLYAGVSGNLVAFACKLSFQRGFEGFVAFLSKTSLIKHYEKSLKAYHFGGHKMIITTEAANYLVSKYFKE